MVGQDLVVRSGRKGYPGLQVWVLLGLYAHPFERSKHPCETTQNRLLKIAAFLMHYNFWGLASSCICCIVWQLNTMIHQAHTDGENIFNFPQGYAKQPCGVAA